MARAFSFLLRVASDNFSLSTSSSFRDALFGASSWSEFPDLKITYCKGLPSLWIFDEEMMALTAPFEFALLMGKFSVTLLNAKNILIKFSHDSDYCRVFSHRSYFVSNCFMKLFKWTPYFYINIESPAIPIWVSFPNLRPHLFSPWILHGLSSLFGRPLRTDNATLNGTRPSVARVLVELDVTKRYPDQVWVGSESMGYTQLVEFENFPSYCGHYKVLGHARFECHVVNPHLANPILNAFGVGVDEIPISVDNIGPVGVPLGMADGNDSVHVAEHCRAIECCDASEVGDHVLVSSPRGVIEIVSPDIGGLVSSNELLIVGDKEFCNVNMGVVNIDSNNLDPYVASPVMIVDRVVSVSLVGPDVNEQLVDVPVALLSSNALNAHLGVRSVEIIGEQIDWLEGSPSSPSGVGEKDVIEHDDFFYLNVDIVVPFVRA
ncbi:hypothetical protein M5K25_012496 [Dendrobium thyrsiflorum]|uniref:DUF4283 domain-containing protein n=1 Tax=Dendrobium thyrsiflorum TaxID=117978 RepID=A0ABD0V461_DENTH